MTIIRVLTQVARHTIAEVSVPRAWNLIATSTSDGPSDKWSTDGSRQAMGHDSNRKVEIDEDGYTRGIWNEAMLTCTPT
jgi:hypothetical protein